MGKSDGLQIPGKRTVQGTRPRWILSVLACCLFLVLSLLLVEAALRLSGWSEVTQMFGYRVALDRRRLFRILPDQQQFINKAGYRGKELDAGRYNRRVLYLGDSFVFGPNVPPEETSPFVLGQILGPSFDVVNMGVFSFGPDQSLVAELDDGVPLSPEWTVLSIFPGNDFGDLFKNQIFIAGEDGEISTSPANIVQQLTPRLRINRLLGTARLRFLSWCKPDEIIERAREYPSYERLYVQLMADWLDLEFISDPASPLSRYKVRLMEEVLRRFKESTQHRSKFLVVILPSYHNIQNDEDLVNAGVPHERYFSLEQSVAQICTQYAISFVDMSPVFVRARALGQLFDETDHHLTARGYRLVAEQVSRVILSDQAARLSATRNESP